MTIKHSGVHVFFVFFFLVLVFYGVIIKFYKYSTRYLAIQESPLIFNFFFYVIAVVAGVVVCFITILVLNSVVVFLSFFFCNCRLLLHRNT